MIEGRRDGEWCRRADDRHHQCHPKRGAELPGHRVEPGGGGKAVSGRRRDGRRADVRQQRPRTDAEHHDAGQPLAEEVWAQADDLHEPQDGAAPDQPAGDQHRAMPDALDDPARGTGHGGGDERPRRQGEPGIEHGIAPHAGQEQDVGQRVAVVACGGDDRHRVGSAEVADAQQGQVEDRRAVPATAANEHCTEGDRQDERAQRPSAGPAPFLPLDDPQHQGSGAGREQKRPEQIGHPPPPGSPTLNQSAPGEDDRRRADRKVDQEHQAPVVGAHKQPAQRRAEAGGSGGDRRGQRHSMRAPLGREGVQHQRQRRGNQQRRPESLENPKGDQDV